MKLYLMYCCSCCIALLGQVEGSEGDIQSRTDPPNGTIISAEAGASNVTTLCCDIHIVSEEEEPQQVVTMWFLENYRDQSLTLITVRDHNDTILVHGDLNTGSFLFSTYQNKLTFLQFVSDFDNTMVICGRGAALNIGHFPLVVFSPPSAPKNLTATTVRDTWVELAWDPPENTGVPELSHYAVLVMKSHTPFTETYTVDALTTTLVLSGLLPSHGYTVTLAAVTQLTAANKTSNFSTSFNVTTLPATDINECDVDHPCDHNAVCNDIEGSFVCVCNDGFSGDGINCQCDSDDAGGACVFTTVGIGVSAAVALLFGIGGFILGVITGTCRPRLKIRTQAANQEVERGTPPLEPTQYEEIVLDVTREISLTGNSAYGCKM